MTSYLQAVCIGPKSTREPEAEHTNTGLPFYSGIAETAEKVMNVFNSRCKTLTRHVTMTKSWKLRRCCLALYRRTTEDITWRLNRIPAVTMTTFTGARGQPAPVTLN